MKIKKLASYFYYFYFGLVYLTSSLVLWLPIFLFVRGKNKYKVAKQIRIFWAKFLTTLIGIKIDVKYESSVIEKQNYIICANHKSYLDIILMYLIINKDFAFLGKSEILKWPVINIFFKRGVDIPVYRGSKTRSHECLELAEKEIKRGRSIVIFPEGGWDKTGKNMRSFKNGAFQLAIDTKCPILPITFKNNYDLFTDHKDISGTAKPGKAKVVVHNSIAVANLNREDLVNLKDQIFQIINKELNCEN
jgi:1-acyl-sn-glycerol-3-phosphate acyltransferase